MNSLKLCGVCSRASPWTLNWDLAAANTSLAYRYQGKYEKALPFARKAVELDPALDSNSFQATADCHSVFPQPPKRSGKQPAYARAAKEAESHLLTDPADAPSWMLLALYRVKSGSPQNAPLLIERAESLGARDMDSQIYKARILELLRKREEALTTLAACFRKGATDLQVVEFPDLQPLRKDPPLSPTGAVKRSYHCCQCFTRW